jgi:hypothetical protein
VSQPSSFGEDACGRIYVTSLANPGDVYRLEGALPSTCTTPAPPSPGGSTGTSGRAPTLRVRAHRPLRVHGRTIELRARCDVGCELTATGTLRARRRRLVLTNAHAHVARPGRLVRLRLRLPRASLVRARRAWRAHRRVELMATLSARSAQGNTSTVGLRRRLLP